jgi:D-glycero-D-manno-heptose 1,7-bisphosphate phosphatase
VREVNRRGGFAFVITNQAGIARGLYAAAAVDRFHAAMQAALRAEGAHIDAFRHCPHHPTAGTGPLTGPCACRKPAPGMLTELMQAWPVDPARSVMVGDSDSDIAAGTAAGIASLRAGDGALDDLVTPFLERAWI